MNASRSPRTRLILLAFAGCFALSTAATAAELAFARSGPPGAPAKLIIQPTDEPAMRLEAWEVIEEFQVRSVAVSEQHIGFPDLRHGNINYQYSVPTSSEPRRYFRQQNVTTSWAADHFYYTAYTRQGSMNLTVRRNETNHPIVTAGSLQEVVTSRWMDVQGYNMYGPFGPEYTQTDTINGTPFGLRYGGPVFSGTKVTNAGKPDSTDQTTTFDNYGVGFYPFDAQAAANYWGADSFSSQRPPGGVFAAPPSPWTESSARWTASGVGAPGAINSASFSYNLELSDEDTKAHVLARFEQGKAIGNLASLPWNTERWVRYGGASVEDDEHWSSSWLYLYNESEYFESDGYIEHQKAQIRFVVPAALRIPGVAYRARLIETFYPNNPPYDAQIVSIFEAELREGQWESPIYTTTARDNGSTEVQYFSARAELIQPRKILALSGSAVGAAPMEYAAARPALQTQFLLPNAAGQDYAERKVLTGSATLQQIDLGDAWGSLWDFDGVSARWSVLPGATASVRLWHWTDDGSPLGKWTLLAPDAELSEYFGSSSDFIFAEAASGGQATVRITIDVGGKQVHDDLVLQSESTIAVLAVDANRDATITIAPDVSDLTTADRPYRFWTNDDIDRLHSFPDSAADTMKDITEREEDDISPTEAQAKLMSPDGWTDNKADSRRDLEDFARLQIHTAGLNDAFKSGQLFLGLRWSDVTGDPGIRVYRQQESTGGLGYLSDEIKAAAQVVEYAIRDARYQGDSASTSINAMVHGAGTFILPASLFANLSETAPKTHLLFEGVKAGRGQLKLVVLRQEGGNYIEVGMGAGVWMDLKPIGDMYEHWSVGNASGGAPAQVAGRIASETGSATPFSYTSTSPEEQKYILYVHGWNMEKWEKERFAETAYKRLWWQGYQGRFGLFTWPCTNRFDETKPVKKLNEGVSDGTNFDRGEWTAWRSGAPLRQLLQTLNGAYGGNLYVFSHSMGGIVVSEALRLQSDSGGGQITRVYVASQAALSAHLYDGTLSTDAGSPNAVQWTYDHPSFEFLGINPGPINYGPQTTNIYKNWFAYVLSGSAVSSSVVGKLVNFYNQNDYALSAPVWQFNQITKPDWPDTGLQPWRYGYAADPSVFSDAFMKTEGDSGSNQTALRLGTRANPQDRHEIMAFAAESYVKAFGATGNSAQAVSHSLNLRSIWPADGGDHKAHTWHSGQFRSSIQKQKSYWKVLLGDQAFDIATTTLP